VGGGRPRAVAARGLAETLRTLRSPDGSGVEAEAALRGTLRPYQQTGVQWLQLLSGLGLGACLADDMGLGKTIQVLALLLLERRRSKGVTARPSLLVAPASLLANRLAEIEKFGPPVRPARSRRCKSPAMKA
jgi:SNF2 family DNA or RNA helicase